MKRPVPAILTAVLLAAAAAPGAILPFGAGQAVAQAPLVFENLSVSGEFGALRIPRIAIEGSNATRADIEALFDPKQAATAAERLRRINARSITIPVIELDQKLPEGTTTTIYRDTIIRDVANGVILQAATPTMSVRGTAMGAGQDGSAIPFEASASGLSMKGVDLGLMLASIFAGGGAPDGPLMPAALEQTVGRIVVKAGDGSTITIGGASVRNFRMRALPRSLIDIVAEAQRNERDKLPDWETRNLALVLPVFSAMGLGSAEITGISAEYGEPGKSASGSLGIDRIAMAGDALLPSTMRLEGLRVSTESGRVNIGELRFDGLDASGVIAAALGAARDGVDPAPAELLPKLGLFRIAGLDIDVPDDRNARNRIVLKLGLFEKAMSAHVGAIPTAVKMTVESLKLDLPPDATGGMREIAELGYRSLDVSAGLDLSWQEAQQTVALKDLSIRSEGMFALAAKGELANVPRELFTTDPAMAAVAALGVAAKSVEARFANAGLIERLIARQAQITRRKPEEVRAEFAAGATLLAPMMLGDHPAARTLGPILGRFIADPRNLKIAISSRDGAGIGVADFMAARNPMDLLGKVDIQAGANE